MTELPVVVIGAGPQGLAAAAHLLERGLTPLVLEAGDGPGATVAAWGHVRLFSGWPELIDPAAARLLASRGWVAPTEGYPTGAEWIEHYLAPLAAALGDVVHYGTQVSGVGRLGRDRLVDAGRDQAPFTVHVNGTDRLLASAVIDASGTWHSPAPAGADGLPALGEATHRDQIVYAIPDADRPDRYAGRHTVVLGAGASALNAINELDRIARHHPGTRVTWALRRGGTGAAYGGGEADQLPERGALGLRARAAVEAGRVDLVTGFRTLAIEAEDTTEDERIRLVGEDGRQLSGVDTVVVVAGFRPDLSFLSELRLDLDPTLQAPRAVAAEVDPNRHSCGSISATGARELAHPGEPGFYLVGTKSYGRAPTFLAMTGYEQVRSVVAMLAGDAEAAERVELVLPETGVCGGSGLYDDPVSPTPTGCCAAPA